MTPSDARPDASLRCVPPADLTAFAQHALPEARRAEISRHLLRCPRCHAAASDAGDLLARLRSFGAASSWQGELGAAVAVARARTRARRLGAVAGAGVGLLLAAGVALLPTSRPGGPGDLVAGAPSPAAPTRSADGIASRAAGPTSPLSDEARALLRAQATDGRWAADGSLGAGRHDEAATGLAVLAILRGRPDALRDPAVARAVASATRWLRGREGSAASLRDDAVATSALLEVFAQTGDAGVRTAVDRGVRRLARDLAAGGALDPASAGWARVALGRARDLGWERVLPTDDAAPAAYPLGGAPGETLVAKALAFVDRSPRS